MKKSIALLLAGLILGSSLLCEAQDTNVSLDTAVSNLLAQAAVLKAQIASAKAAATIQTVVFSNGLPVATNTALAPVTAASVTSYLPVIENLIAAFGSFGAAILILARTLRKLIPDNLQTGAAGTVLKNIALEINPHLTPTPPGVPATTELKDTRTGAIVEPVAVPPVNPPPKV